MIGFIPLIARIVIKVVPSKGLEDEEYHLEYISNATMVNTEGSILEAKKEVSKFGNMVTKMTSFVPELLVETDKKKFKKKVERIVKYEEITDNIESEIGAYLAKVSEGELNERSSLQIRAMLSIANDLETIGDINNSMGKVLQRKMESKIYFIPKQRENLLEMFKLLNVALDVMKKNLNNGLQGKHLEEAEEAEKAINKFRNQLKEGHLKSIEKGKYKFDSGMIYTDLFAAIESIGDRIISISEAACGKIS